MVIPDPSKTAAENQLDIENLQKALDNVSFESITGKLNGLSKLYKSFVDNAKTLQIDTSSAVSNVDRLTGAFGKLTALTTRFDAFKTLQVQSGLASSTMVSQFDTLVSRFNNFDEAAARLAGTIPERVLKAGKSATRAWLEAASSAEALENTYLNLQAAAGRLDDEFEKSGGIDKLNDRVAAFSSQILDAAASTGIHIDQVSKYVTSLGAIPGALNQIIRTEDGATTGMSSLVGVLRLASGAHRDVSEVITAMNIAYEKLGAPQGKVTDNVQRGAQLFSLMSEASSKLNLRFQDTEGFLTTVAEIFKHVGDNTQGATRILERFTGALQETGLTAKASVDIVQGMVESIKNLEMGTKALISVRTGGPGGLQGAFRVEQLIREGKIDEVSRMLERTLRQQFGGRIVTQAEAAQSPESAAQFMRQRTLLQSGAFGQLARNPEDATRLLEAMARGPAATTATIKDAMGATKQTADRGNEIQNRQYTVLNRINNSMDRLVFLNQERFMIDAREAIGTGRRGAEFTNSLERYRQLTSDRAATEAGREPLPVEQMGLMEGRRAIDDMAESMEVIPNVAKKAGEYITGATNTVSQLINEHKQQSKRTDDVKNVQREQEFTQQLVNRGAGMQATAQRAMRQPAPTLAGRAPIVEAMKHEVSVKPLEVNIQVTRDPDTQTTVQTNYPNATVREVVNNQIKGFQDIRK